MRSTMLTIALVWVLASAMEAGAQIPALPDGALTRWVVGQPHEVVGYVTFDPATVKDRLPETLRFITLKELATGGISWAKTHLADHPSRGHWGISFLEIVLAGTFTLDGRSPAWPQDGAAALWFARVAAAEPSSDLGYGQPLLALEFWIPDRAFVAYMRGKGHYATYGDVRLRRTEQAGWRGSVTVAGLRVDADCVPTGPVAGGVGSAGAQAFFPPRLSSVENIVRVAFAGHREQECRGDSSWSLQGTHPLARGVVLQPSTLQFGYELIGGAYVK
jgi:hypothetical protein